MILILTNKYDVHADEAVRTFGVRGVPVFRLNSEDLLTKYQCDLSIDDEGAWRGIIIDELGRTLDLSAPRVAWFRKPEFQFSSEVDDPNAQAFVASEAKALIEVLYSLPSLTWVNDPFVARRSKVKFQQLLLAQSLGMKTPATFITNRPKSAEEFFARCGNVALVKAIYTGNVVASGVPQGIPSTRIEAEDFHRTCENISLCPTQLQRYVDKAYELRVTVIGENVFATKIESQVHEETRIDWRLHTALNPHSTYDLPKAVETFCTTFLRAQGLLFGAMDFIRTPDGDYVFLENNPFGQYLWLELETGIPLTSAMCDFLCRLASR